jgi:GTP cyclohydrolase II
MVYEKDFAQSGAESLQTPVILQDTGYATYGLLLHISQRPLNTIFGDFCVDVFQNLYTRSYVLLVSLGDLSSQEPLLIRVHSSCITSEAFGAYDCDCAPQLNLALQRISEVGRGAVVYLLQEGRGAGYSAKARDRMLVQASHDSKTTFEAYAQLGLHPDHRRYSEVALALRLVGSNSTVRLLTNNPEKVHDLETHGICVDSTEAVVREASPFNAHYLRSKLHAGHTLESVASPIAKLPERVHAFAPTPLTNAPHLVQMASYLLPMRATHSTEHCWFWSHVYFDLLARCERVVLTYCGKPDDKEKAPYVRIQRESLLERFPIKVGICKRQWQASVDHMVRHGHGIAIFPTADGYDDIFAASLIPFSGIHNESIAERSTEESVYRLLAHHAPERVIIPLFTSIDDDQSQRAMIRQLDRRGFTRVKNLFIPIADQPRWSLDNA